ncbi:MAG: VWA domain-containing protein [Alphaproteobacteria bacterium]|nr:VWA domain-containing protein [Alphaproteobacteria bacterium]
MQRWHLTLGLAGTAVLAAMIAPTVQARFVAKDPVDPIPGDPTVTTRVPVPPKGFDGALELTAALDQDALLQGSGEDRYLVIEVTAPDMPGDVRRPVNLAVVMDTSGSMAGRGKIDNARMAASELISQLGPEDTFALVSFSDRGRTVVSSQHVTDPARLQRQAAGIRPGGGTNLSGGLQLGLDALSDPSLTGIKRVVILSDGMANLGVTDTASLARMSGEQVEAGISVSAMGLGLDYNEDLLSAMSDAGGGRYHFVDQPGQLATMFQTELQQMTRVAGREVAVDVKLPDGVRLEEVFGWDADLSTDGYRVFLGDVHGGETRKIVARVSVPDGELGTLNVADVDLRYTDADSGKAAEEAAVVAAKITQDNRVAARSVNRRAGVSAAKAHAGRLMDESARDYADGDVAGNQAKLEQAQGLLRSMRTRYDAPELDFEAEEVAVQQQAFSEAAPASDDGLWNVKKTKEAALEYAR